MSELYRVCQYTVDTWVITKYVILKIYFISAKIVENTGHRTAYTGLLPELNLVR